MGPTTRRTEIRPQPGPQTEFLATPADIAVYGGAAGGGKTWALLLEPLRHVKNPRFGGVIFRRTSPQITNEGGLWDEAGTLYPLAGAEGLVGSLDWRFPSGANVGFRHLQHEKTKYDWQGAQLAYLGFDELPHFTESQFFYLLSRVRSTSGVRPYVRATCNPEPGWVREFLAQWVAKDHRDPAKSGELRHFTRVNGEVVWGRDPAELRARTGKRTRSVTFIRASVYDNPALLAKDPDYLANLQALPPVEQARLLDGDWDVRREGLIFGELLDCIVDEIPARALESRKRPGGIDFGFNNPFCALAGVLDHDDVLWIHFERYQSFATLPVHSEALPRDGTEWACDPSRPESIAELAIAGHTVRACVHLGAKPVQEGIDKVQDRIRTGRLKVHRRCRNLIREAGLYCYDPATNQPIDLDNHACDGLRYLVVALDRGRAIRRPKLQPPAQPEPPKPEPPKPRPSRGDDPDDPDDPDWWT